jgi:hypothetical protein
MARSSSTTPSSDAGSALSNAPSKTTSGCRRVLASSRYDLNQASSAVRPGPPAKCCRIPCSIAPTPVPMRPRAAAIGPSEAEPNYVNSAIAAILLRTKAPANPRRDVRLTTRLRCIRYPRGPTEQAEARDYMIE